MATKTTVKLVDDLDGFEASESVAFSLDGASYEIDLSEKNAKKLRDALAAYVAHARRVDDERRVRHPEAKGLFARSGGPRRVTGWGVFPR